VDHGGARVANVGHEQPARPAQRRGLEHHTGDAGAAVGDGVLHRVLEKVAVGREPRLAKGRVRVGFAWGAGRLRFERRAGGAGGGARA